MLFTCTYTRGIISSAQSLSYIQLLCDPMNYSPPGSSVHGISQAGILERVAIPFSRGSSWPRTEPVSVALAGGFFITKPPGKPKRGTEDGERCPSPVRFKDTVIRGKASTDQKGSKLCLVNLCFFSIRGRNEHHSYYSMLFQNYIALYTTFHSSIRTSTLNLIYSEKCITIIILSFCNYRIFC